MDDIPAWEIHGTSYGFSSIGIPIARPGFDSFNETISAWVDREDINPSRTWPHWRSMALTWIIRV
jgi:hypothetical protein